MTSNTGAIQTITARHSLCPQSSTRNTDSFSCDRLADKKDTRIGGATGLLSSIPATRTAKVLPFHRRRPRRRVSFSAETTGRLRFGQGAIRCDRPALITVFISSSRLLSLLSSLTPLSARSRRTRRRSSRNPDLCKDQGIFRALCARQLPITHYPKATFGRTNGSLSLAPPRRPLKTEQLPVWISPHQVWPATAKHLWCCLPMTLRVAGSWNRRVGQLL